jgi:protein glucosyltransferase
VLLSRAKPHLAFASYTKNQAYRSPADTLGEEPATEVKLEDHCKYKYLFNFRGVAASFRYKHLFACNSLVFHVGARGDDFIEFYYEGLQPWVHYIPVREDMSDVEELITFARENDDIARQIAQNGADFIRDNLRYDDVKDYWRHLLIEYTKLVDWQVVKHPELNQITKDKWRVVDKD